MITTAMVQGHDPSTGSPPRCLLVFAFTSWQPLPATLLLQGRERRQLCQDLADDSWPETESGKTQVWL